MSAALNLDQKLLKPSCKPQTNNDVIQKISPEIKPFRRDYNDFLRQQWRSLDNDLAPNKQTDTAGLPSTNFPPHCAFPFRSRWISGINEGCCRVVTAPVVVSGAVLDADTGLD